MEFPFAISKVFSIAQDGFIILDASSYSSRSRPVDNSSYLQHYSKTNQSSAKDPAKQILDQLGEASAKVINQF